MRTADKTRRPRLRPGRPRVLGDDAVDGRFAAQVATIHADHLSESGTTLIEYELAGDADAVLVEHEFAHASMAANAGKLAVVGPDVTLDSGIGIGVARTTPT